MPFNEQPCKERFRDANAIFGGSNTSLDEREVVQLMETFGNTDSYR